MDKIRHGFEETYKILINFVTIKNMNKTSHTLITCSIYKNTRLILRPNQKKKTKLQIKKLFKNAFINHQIGFKVNVRCAVTILLEILFSEFISYTFVFTKSHRI